SRARSLSSREARVTGLARPAARAWLMWGVPAFLFLFAFFHRAAPGVFAKELMQAFGVTGTVIGLLSATYFYAYAALMIPAGGLLDRVGARWGVAPRPPAICFPPLLLSP